MMMLVLLLGARVKMMEEACKRQVEIMHKVLIQHHHYYYTALDSEEEGARKGYVSNKVTYYAVQVGIVPGVYRYWGDAARQVQHTVRVLKVGGKKDKKDTKEEYEYVERDREGTKHKEFHNYRKAVNWVAAGAVAISAADGAASVAATAGDAASGAGASGAEGGDGDVSEADVVVSVCPEWQECGRCSLRERLEHCPHPHPTQPVVKLCFDWTKRNMCSKLDSGATCSFAHPGRVDSLPPPGDVLFVPPPNIPADYWFLAKFPWVGIHLNCNIDKLIKQIFDQIWYKRGAIANKKLTVQMESRGRRKHTTHVTNFRVMTNEEQIEAKYYKLDGRGKPVFRTAKALGKALCAHLACCGNAKHERIDEDGDVVKPERLTFAMGLEDRQRDEKTEGPLEHKVVKFLVEEQGVDREDINTIGF